MTPTVTRRGWTIASAISFALILTGCGSAASNAPAESPSPSPTTPVATASPMPTPTPPPSPTAASSPTELPTTGRIEVADRGYALTLPDNWFRIDLDDKGIQEVMKAGIGKLPDSFGTTLKGQMQQFLANGVSLLAYRFADANAPTGTNINVLTLPAHGFSLDTIAQLNIAQLKQLVGPGEEIASTHVTLPAGDAIRLEYGMKFGTTNARSPIIQYFLIDNGNQLFLTCTLPGSAGSIADECRTVAESIEFLP